MSDLKITNGNVTLSLQLQGEYDDGHLRPLFTSSPVVVPDHPFIGQLADAYNRGADVVDSPEVQALGEQLRRTLIALAPDDLTG